MAVAATHKRNETILSHGGEVKHVRYGYPEVKVKVKSIAANAIT